MSARVVSNRQVTGRRKHSCWLCLKWTEIGARVNVQTVADGDQIWQARSHVVCAESLSAFWAERGEPDPFSLGDDVGPDVGEFRAFLAARELSSEI